VKRANIILTGFMGTGKSAVGREVARRLGRPFVDMDEVIAAREGRSIPEIFASSGEQHFRQLEAALCRELAAQRGLVIATGGGTLVPPENRETLGRAGVLFCLSASVDEILRRLNSCEDRPLLAAPSRRARIEALLAERASAYAAIPHQIDTTGKGVEQVAEEICEQVMSGHRRDDMVISVHTPEGPYDIALGSGRLAQLGELLIERQLTGSVALVSDDIVGPLHARKALLSVAQAGLPAELFTLPAGEEYKTLDTACELYDRFLAAGIDRSSTVVALGGGVIGDLAGFVAATYMRGLPLVQCPTSLLAMVDASVGGKVAVDHPRAKNLIGAFKQPALVVADPAVLDTLPAEELRAGLAEVVKHGLIAAPDLFEHLERRGMDDLLWIVERAVAVKVAVVEEDPFEHGRRAVLNLGHTFGHALEVLSDFQLRHGEGVSIGLVIAARVAAALGLWDSALAARVERLLQRLGLPTTWAEFSPAAIWEAMRSDKKKRGQKLRFVLPRVVGEVIILDDVPRNVVMKVLEDG
jgi:3-dehydroquinate synthase